MNLSAESQKSVDSYLASLRKHLRDLADQDARDIVEEIRFHILDKTSKDTSPETVASILDRLGTPEELAGRYRTDELMKRAQSSGSLFLTLCSLFRWATLSLVGLTVFAASVIGYALGGILVIVGFYKLIYPRNGGIWFNPRPGGKGIDGEAGFSFVSGGTWIHPGHEIIGMWLVPIGLILGSGLLLLTFRFGSWSIRKFWRPRALRAVSTGL
jgi:HAAS